MIALFTDFGIEGPYIGQMTAAIYKLAPNIPVVNLFADAPAYNSFASGHLLAAYYPDFPQGTVFLCVVDPGVGSKERMPVVIQTGQYWFVGPYNGLFDPILARSTSSQLWKIAWAPERLSASFHGRDLFAPVAAHLAANSLPTDWLEPYPLPQHISDTDLLEVIYIDHYGNAMTGIRANSLDRGTSLVVAGHLLPRVRTFSDVKPDEPFCYENANGLMEIAVNQGSAAKKLQLGPGSTVKLSQ